MELPVRYGELSITNPARTSQREFNCSKQITEPLVQLILQQDQDIKRLSLQDIDNKKADLKKEKEDFLKTRYDILFGKADQKLRNHLSQAVEKGASSWLTALPLKSLNYVLNKQESQDSIQLRYGWSIKGMPTYCSCGEKNSVYHALDCKLGGYVSMRHDSIRDTLAYFLREAKCKDVRVEPPPCQ